MLRRRLAVGLAVATWTGMAVPAAWAVKIMTYNTLNYQGSGASASKKQAFRDVIAAADPDMLIVMEISSSTVASAFKTDILDMIAPAQWSMAPFADLGDTSAVAYYKTAVFDDLGGAVTITATPRSARRWQFRPDGYTSSAAIFYPTGMHLKAGSTTNDMDQRATATFLVRNNSNSFFSPTSRFFYCGDFNLQSSSEGAYVNLTGSQADNDGQAIDPLNPTLATQNWNSSSTYSCFHTQSTRVTDLGDGGATGGLDDRFDFFLLSNTLYGSSGLSYIPGSYREFGNDCLHLNRAINASPTNGDVGQAVADALHIASDHLPVLIELQLPAKASADSNLAFGSVIVGAAAQQNLTVTNIAGVPAENLVYTLTAPSGFTAPGGTFIEPAGGGSNLHAIAMITATAGIKSGTLTINSNDVDMGTIGVGLSGTVLDHAAPSVTANVQTLTGNVDFDTVLTGSTSDRGVSIYNFGYDSLQALLNVYAFQVTGPDAGRFSLTSFSAVDIGASPASFTVRFNAVGAAAGPYSATLEFSCRDQTGVLGGGALPTLSFNLSAIVEGCLYPFDADADGDVDLFDFAELDLCFSGLGVLYPGGHHCLCLDSDGDFDVDLGDAGALQNAFSPEPVIPQGACCSPDGLSCADGTQVECVVGTYMGDGTTCATVTCPTPPQGACCAGDGTCAEVTEVNCTDGTYMGDGTTCGGVSCSSALFTLDKITVPGGGAGPAYAFVMSKFEITVAQFTAFLNNAQANAGNERGANMLFGGTGDVGFADGSDSDALFSASAAGLTYQAGNPLGSRYSFNPSNGNHPIAGVTWYGALKFCNWLTIDQGLAVSERCYTEGAGASAWHPMSISAGNWAARDLNATERQDLVANYRGYRLPMDNVALATGHISTQENAYGEWYKAAAYSPGAPGGAGPGGATISPNHRFYGFGRDAIAGADANYSGSGDPFDNATTPTGYYDGTNHGGAYSTNNTGNFYGFYDLSGNVWEWGQDYASALTSHAVRGGSWFSFSNTDLAAAYRLGSPTLNTFAVIGIRVVRVP